jgi:hypothetical protein
MNSDKKKGLYRNLYSKSVSVGSLCGQVFNT